MRPDEEREGRIRALLRYIEDDCNGVTTLNDVYRFALRTWGYKFRLSTVMSYLQVLLMAGKITINDNHVRAVAKKDERKAK
jgi:hypothetical protein